MRAPWARGLLGLTLGLVLNLAAAAPLLAKPPVWIASRGATTLILFGSVHLLPAGLDWAPASLLRAEASARHLWFEIPINKRADAEAARGFVVKGALPPGASLWPLLRPEVAAEVRRAALASGASADGLSRMRPWLADVTLSLRADLAAGARPGAGVEQAIEAAVPLSAQHHAFESAGEQIDLLADAPPADQIASLEVTAEEILERPDTYARIIRDWMNGDTDALRSDALEPLKTAAPRFFDRLITERNRRWALALRSAPRGSNLVVVGMAHMIGPEGLPALLRRGGWTVSRLDSPGAAAHGGD